MPTATNRREFLKTVAAAGAACSATVGGVLQAQPPDTWTELFDGRSLDGWQAAQHNGTWRVEDGCLVGHGPGSHLFYRGSVGNHDFRNFELQAEVRTQPSADSGIFVHTQFQPSGCPARGCEVQINNAHPGAGDGRGLDRTGSLHAVRNIYKPMVSDGQWFRLRLSVIGNRVRIWVDGLPTVDYVEREQPHRQDQRPQRLLSHGTIALQAPKAASHVAFRSVNVRLLPDDADPRLADRAPDEGYGLIDYPLDRFAAAEVPVIDFHVHLRGGMTVEKAIERQAVTGINIGVLKNIGKGWAIENDGQLRELLNSTERKPVFVGLQVNDRDWMHKHAAKLLGRLDYALGDTMIMPMPHDDSPPVKLWLADQYTIDDPQAWMERYVRHNLRVLAEPVTILANPTYLPAPVAEMYDELWTDERMRQIIRAAVGNGVALEINARSGLPHDRFIRMAKSMGAKFTFGSNNFQDDPIDMSRCLEAIGRYRLTRADMYVPASKLRLS